jgi:hypothetical protein
MKEHMRTPSKRDIVKQIVTKSPQTICLKIDRDIFKTRMLHSSDVITRGSLVVKRPLEILREAIILQIIEHIPTRNSIKRQIIAEAFACHL